MPGSRSHLRLRDIPALPLLFLLHILFTLLSLLLRTYQLLTSPRPLKTPASFQRPIRHIAVVLRPSTSSYDVKVRQETLALKESVKRVVRWASEMGVSEVSVFDGKGLLQNCQEELVRDLLRLPPSPPGSRPATPARLPNAVQASSVSKPRSRSSVQTIIIPPHHSQGNESEMLKLHVLAPSTRDVVADLTASYIKKQIPLGDIQQDMLDRDVRDVLHLSHDPDILIIHLLSSPSFFKALLPRPAPQLSGYPFWCLRITEIYQHPTPLPRLIPPPLLSLLHQARTSNLSLLRKVARSLPLTDPDESETIHGSRRVIKGAMGREVWDGAMRAWGGVEQRLG
ncbi:hypothetical protein BCR39DRAFT_524797, partial [Naematelia encephala]